jgi:alpha-mannosidase
VVVSTIKAGEDGTALVIRLFNPSSTDRAVKITSSIPIREACRCDLSESRLFPTPLADPKTLELSVRGKEIVTLKLELDQ